jgi:signal peptidase I
MTELPAEQTPSVAPINAPQNTRSTLITTIAWFRDLMLSVLIATLIILFLYRPVKVEGTSMMPSLYDQERLFINQFSYKFGGDIHRGDTVVFWFPGDTTKSYIKRVIGLPGDNINIQGGTVYLNGRQLLEPYVPETFRDTMSISTVHVPTGEYFVLGDHRSSSNDSRVWGFVPRSYIYGKAVFVFWPMERLGTIR